MRTTWHSSSCSSPILPSPLKYTPKSLLTFTRTLTPTWTVKYISINTFISSVSLGLLLCLRRAGVTLSIRLQNWGVGGMGGGSGQLYTHFVLLQPNFYFGALCFYQIFSPLKSTYPCYALIRKGRGRVCLCDVSLQLEVVCDLPGDEDGTGDSLKIPVDSGCHFWFSKCVMFEVLTTILSF